MFENSKTPENDGIPFEIYKKLWDILVDQVDVFNSSFQLEQMTTSQRQAIIALIDKKGNILLRKLEANFFDG